MKKAVIIGSGLGGLSTALRLSYKGYEVTILEKHSTPGGRLNIVEQDGFRFDMAEMVPVEFWSYMNSAIKMKNPETFLLAEVYNPDLYRAYIKKGKMDYLYDKVQLYDTLKHVMQGHGSTDHIPAIQDYLKDIEHNMLHFLENHDEQRIASPEFAGNAEKGKPAMVVSATISTRGGRADRGRSRPALH